MTDTQLHPAWREALKKFLQSELATPGSIVSYDWLYSAFQLTRPLPMTPKHEAERSDLLFLAHYKQFENALLRDHQTALANVRGVGYRVVPPKEQTRWAEDEGLREIKRGIGRLGDRLSNVDMAQLTSAERKENADALAKWSMMRGMVKQSYRRALAAPNGENGEEL